MNVNEFDYNLPEELIAQTPLKDRSSSKLLVLNKNTGEIEHHHFKDIINYLDKGDTLVLNDTKVIPARLIGTKEETNAVIEILLLKDLNNNTWECLTRPAKRVKVGTVVSFGDGSLKAKCIKEREEGIREYELIYDGILYEILDKLGTMPLPPYIHEKLKDQDRYQTIYAKNIGSAAAPTAGLHFTKELMNEIKEKGVNICYLTLHIGLGTFRPVQVVGTTSVRTLETVMTKYGKLVPCKGSTDIFIYPGYKYKIVDNLITNFHLPKSTLIMLVSALAGKENILNAYKVAVENKYRFFSFGDSMFIYDK